MFISEEHSFIFVEIPKTGSTSMAKAFSKMGLKRFRSCPVHASLEDLKKACPDIDLSRYFKFCFTRNPWDQEVSTYFFYKTGRVAKKIEEGLQRDPVQVARHRRAVEYDFSDWLKHRDPQKKENEYANFDAVYKFETMQEGFSEILRKFGFDDVELLKLNASKRGRYQDYYDTQAKEIVEVAYADRIKRFGYSYD